MGETKGEMMELTVFERLLLRNIVPEVQGWNYANMKDARELLEGLFTEEEEADLHFEQEEKQVKWRVAKDDGTPIPQKREMPVSEGLRKKIGIFLKQLDKEEKLGFEHMSLYEKMVDPS